MKKRIVSILVAALMVLSILPGVALAEGETHHHDNMDWTSITNLSEISASGYYCLDSDVTLTSTWMVPTGTINLCLNGHVVQQTSHVSVITIPNGATLNLYDCNDTEKAYKFEVQQDGLWEYAGEWPAQGEESDTCKKVVGGVITSNSSSTIGGVYVMEDALFALYGGTIVGNTADNGGGVYVSTDGTFTMEGGAISGNSSANGGGVYFNTNSYGALAGGVICDNVASGNGGGVYLYTQQNTCLAEGSMITMADGSRKPIEQIENNDLLRVFDHKNGEVTTAPVGFVVKQPNSIAGAFTLHFSNGIDVTPVGGRSFYEFLENKYVILNSANAADYIGHSFYNLDQGCWETLESVTLIEEPVTAYALVTRDVLNCAAEGMLSCEDSIITACANVFEFDAEMKVDQVKRAANIEEWGLSEPEDFSYLPEEFLNIVPYRYAKIAIGKHLTTEEEIRSVSLYYCQLCQNAASAAEDKDNTKLKKSLPSKKRTALLLGAAPAGKINLDTVKTLTTDGAAGGLILGGTIQIYGNKSGAAGSQKADDVFLVVDDSTVYNHITIGTGYSENGVIAPEADMWVGVLSGGSHDLKVAYSAKEGDEEYFSSNDPNLYVAFNAEGYLELKIKPDSSSTGAPIGWDNPQSITVESSTNGTVSADKKSAPANALVTLTVTPDENYVLDTLTVLDKSSRKIETTDAGDGTYTFKMSQNPVTVSATFTKDADTAPDKEKEPEAAKDGSGIKETKEPLTTVPEKEEKPEEAANESVDSATQIILTINSKTATVFGKNVENDVAPVIRNDRTMLPARVVAEALGANVFWNEEARKVTVQRGTLVIEIFVDSAVAYVNGVEVALDSPAFIENARTYVPMRFLAEALGATVAWDEETQKVTITPNTPNENE